MSDYKFTIVAWTLVCCIPAIHADDDLRPVALSAKVTAVQPMTGIVLWSTNEAVRTAPIQLEYSYFTYDKVVRAKGEYDWSPVEEWLDDVARRGHQGIIRWHDTYVGKPTGIPGYITALADYRGVTAKSEGRRTEFPDWSHAQLKRFLPKFFTAFAQRYDNDPRLAFVQVGFGLWAEYHIYDGPMKLGGTFPAKAYQAEFVQQLSRELQHTPWMISVDAAGDHAPYAESAELLALPFGLFDDSFNHKLHKSENEPNWNVLGRDRWKVAPTGGEFSFYVRKDQQDALAESGPHGISFEKQAVKFHISFMIGDAQPRFQNEARIREAGMACGYRFRVTQFFVGSDDSRVTIENVGIAPIYYEAFPAVGGVRSSTSLKGLLPGETREFAIPSGGDAPKLTIECDRLVKGQQIQYDAELVEQ